MNALVYLRVSTDKQADRGVAIPAQREACLKYAREKNYEIIGEYADEGESARSADRPKLIEMLDRCEKDKDVEAVIFYDVSRLARNRYDYAFIKKQLEKKRIRIVSVTEPIDDSPEGQLLEGVMSTIAEFYSTQSARKVKLGMLQKARNGELPGRAKYGYKNCQEKVSTNKVRSWIEPDKIEGPWVERAFSLFATGNYSLYSLAEYLQDEGFPTRKGNPLRKSLLAKILRDKAYIGYVIWGEVENPDGKHKPLVEEDIFWRVQELLDTRNAGANRKRKHNFLLRGLAFCGECESRWTAGFHKSRLGKKYGFYGCQKAKNGQRVKCDQQYIAIGKLDEQFADVFGQIELPESAIEKIRARVQKIFDQDRAVYDKTRKSVLSQIENNKQRQATLLKKLLDETISDELYTTTSKEL